MDDKMKQFVIRAAVTVFCAIIVLFFFKILVLDQKQNSGTLKNKQIEESAAFIPPVSVPINEAASCVGRNIMTEGTITKTHNTGKVCFMNFKQGLNLYLTVVIFASDFKKFPDKPEEYYLNKMVKVSGKVKEYKGTPEIILNSISQIEIVK